MATQEDGLVRRTRRKIELLSDLTDLPVGNNYVIREDPDGAVWIGGVGLTKVSGRRVENFSKQRGSAKTPFVKAIAFDRNGKMWVGAENKIFEFRDGVLLPVRSFETVWIHTLFFDESGDLWIGGDRGLWKYTTDGETTGFTTNDGLAANSVHYITQSRDGTIWIGTIGGLSRYREGRFENLTPENGLSGSYVREILEDNDGTIWIGTYGGGLNRLRGNALHAITAQNGLIDNFVSRILVDDEGRFWILGNLGVFAVDRAELNAVADQEKNSLVGAEFGVADGMKSSEASGGHQPAGIRTRDGKLWFPMIKDVVVIDPKKIDRVPPKVVIESAVSRPDDGTASKLAAPLADNTVVSVETGRRDLEIRFTGLSFTKPKKIRFLYRLEGLDAEWTDAGTRREAIYPYLPPGKYTFFVRAVNADGLWSENTARLTIDVAKAFWQTWWFNSLLLAAGAGVVLLIFVLRVRRLDEQRVRQEEFSARLINAHESERRRIATELHDGLGQNLLIIKNWVQLGLDADAGPEEVRDRMVQISEAASDAIEETRAIVKNLSPQNLKRLIEQTQAATGVLFEHEIDDLDGLFPEQTEISIYRIVQECLNNIIKHSESPRARILISRVPGALRLLVQDFGKGFSVSERHMDLTSAGFGLENISQRVRLLKGELTIESAESEGTTIIIKLRV